MTNTIMNEYNPFKMELAGHPYGVLKSLPVHLGTDLIFPEIAGIQLTAAFKRACKRGGIEDFRFHDLRHSFASHLTMRGVNLRTVQTFLGHKDLKMIMRYNHLSPERLREAVQNLDKSLTIKEGNRENLAQQSIPSCRIANYTNVHPKIALRGSNCW